MLTLLLVSAVEAAVTVTVPPTGINPERFEGPFGAVYVVG
jgi:hypothetical protein